MLVREKRRFSASVQKCLDQYYGYGQVLLWYVNAWYSKCSADISVGEPVGRTGEAGCTLRSFPEAVC